MNGLESQLLANALVQAFSLGELRGVVLTTFNENLGTIVNINAPLSEVAFDLVAWVNRAGHVEALLQAVEKARPDNEFLREAALAVRTTTRVQATVRPERNASAITGGSHDESIETQLSRLTPAELARLVTQGLGELPDDIAAAARRPELTVEVLIDWARDRRRIAELRAALVARGRTQK